MNQLFNFKTISLLLLASITGGLSWYAYNQKSALRFPKFFPYSFGNMITVKRYDDEGLLKSQLFSPYIENKEDSNITLFFKPKVWIYQKDDPPWVVTADQATADKSYTTIILTSHVVMSQQPTHHSNGMQLLTSLLTIKPKEELAFTNEAVQYNQINPLGQNSVVMNAKGLKANQKTGHIELLHEVNIMYQPRANKKS